MHFDHRRGHGGRCRHRIDAGGHQQPIRRCRRRTAGRLLDDVVGPHRQSARELRDRVPFALPGARAGPGPGRGRTDPRPVRRGLHDCRTVGRAPRRPDRPAGHHGRRARAGGMLGGRPRLRPRPCPACAVCLPRRRHRRPLPPGHERGSGRRDPPADRPRAYGLVYWAVNLALSVGLALGGLVAERSFVALFLADAGTSLVAAAIVLFRVPETRPQGVVHEPALRGLVKVFADGPFLSFLLLHLAALAVFVQWQLALPIDMAAHGLGPSAYAFLMALNCAGVVLLQPILSPRLHRVDAALLLALSAALFGLGYGVNAIGGSLAVYGVGTALWTVGEVIGFPVASTMVANLAPAALRGRYQGAFAMCWGAAFTISPVVAGEVIQRFGARALWLLCLAVALAVSAGHLLTAEPRRRRLAALERSEAEQPPPVTALS